MKIKLQNYEKNILTNYCDEMTLKTDRLFFWLFLFQWIMCITIALYEAPVLFNEHGVTIHLHVYLAVLGGGIISSLPMYLTYFMPGNYLNRYAVAAAQMFYSILLIHLTNGRIETHFHIFVSLAFIAFYRDFRPIILATIITAADHFLRGFFLPESIYGVLSASHFRAFEHTSWVLFEDSILYVLIKNGVLELKTIVQNEATIKFSLENVEKLVEERTCELKETQSKLIEQQQQMAYSAKMSSLGEMAAGVAHEINTPLAIISMRVEQMQDCINNNEFDAENFLKYLNSIKTTNDRIAKIVKGLSFFSRNGSLTPSQNIRISSVVEDTLSLCREKFKNNGVELRGNFQTFDAELCIECRPVEISQVLLNLLNNSYDAISQYDIKWVAIDLSQNDNVLEISITDCGTGIPKDLQEKVFSPFFTTKELGKGTGLGLSISKGIIEKHNGSFGIDNQSPNTKFVIQLPLTGCPQALSG